MLKNQISVRPKRKILGLGLCAKIDSSVKFVIALTKVHENAVFCRNKFEIRSAIWGIVTEIKYCILDWLTRFQFSIAELLPNR